MLPPTKREKGEGVTELGGRNLLSLLYFLPAMNNQKPFYHHFAPVFSSRMEEQFKKIMEQVQQDVCCDA